MGRECEGFGDRNVQKQQLPGRKSIWLQSQVPIFACTKELCANVGLSPQFASTGASNVAPPLKLSDWCVSTPPTPCVLLGGVMSIRTKE